MSGWVGVCVTCREWLIAVVGCVLVYLFGFNSVVVCGSYIVYVCVVVVWLG